MKTAYYKRHLKEEYFLKLFFFLLSVLRHAFQYISLLDFVKQLGQINLKVDADTLLQQRIFDSSPSVQNRSHQPGQSLWLVWYFAHFVQLQQDVNFSKK